MSPEDDPSVIAGFRAGDEAAFESIIAAHKEPLHRFIFRYVNDASEAEDILVRTFTKAWQSRTSYQPRAKLSTWLHTIATNLCRDHARKRKRRPADFSSERDWIDSNSPESLLGGDTGPDPSTAAADHEEALLLRRAIDELPHDLRAALILCALEGHSHESAAQILHCSAKAIETRIYRAKQQLRGRLQRYGVG